MRRKKPAWRRVLLWVPAAAVLIAAAVLLLRLVNPGKTYTLPGDPDPALKGQQLEVHVIDVGQADSTLLMQGKACALIDTGGIRDGELVVAYLKAQRVKKLDYLVLTHFHSDHIGGALQVLETFDVANILISDLELGPAPTSRVAIDLLEKLVELQEKGKTQVLVPTAGETFDFGKGSIQVIGTGLPCEDDINNTSLITLFCFDNFSFYSGGDSETDAELALLQSTGGALHADLYKVSHHGSYTSSSPQLVQQLQPLAAIVSCGYENEYGHPHFATLNTLEIADADVWRTDQNGSVVAVIQDGQMTVRGER